MVELTLLEVHFEDSKLTASAGRTPGEKDVGAGRESEEGTGEEPAEGPSSRAGSAVAAVIGLAFLVALAYVVRKTVLAGNDDEGFVDDEYSSTGS